MTRSTGPALVGALVAVVGTVPAAAPASAQEPATVFGVSVGAAGAAPSSAAPGDSQLPQEPVSYQARQAMLESRPFVASSVVDVPDSQRTVFYNPRALEGSGGQVIIQPPEEVTAVPEGVVMLASWLVPVGDQRDRLGEVIGFAGEQVIRFGRTTIHLHDDIRMRFDVPGGPTEGDEFLIYRVGRTIDGVGDVLVPTGRVTVSHSDELGVVGIVTGEHHRMQVGDLVTRVRTFSLERGIHPVPIGSGARTTVLAFQDQKELYLPGDFAFIDIGRSNGLRVGDELVGRGEDVMGGERFPVARFQVVGLGENVATVRLRSVRAPGSLVPGLPLVLDRMMP